MRKPLEREKMTVDLAASLFGKCAISVIKSFWQYRSGQERRSRVRACSPMQRTTKDQAVPRVIAKATSRHVPSLD
jgi:hypothetical protein